MNDEQMIRQAIADWGNAFCTKDIDRVIALYAPDAVVFDAIPPFSSGLAALREKLVACLPYFPEYCAVETHDLTLAVGADLASAHFIWRFVDLPPGHPAGRHSFRSSMVWARQPGGGWLITHDHCSAPFDPYTEKVVRSPEAAVASSGETACNRPNPVGWFEIYVDDMVRAKAFYSAVFGVEFTRLESPVELWAFPMQVGSMGISGALVRLDEERPRGNGTIVYFHCDDCAIESARAEAAGGTLHKPKFSIGQYGHIALLADPEGNMIGLHSMR